METELQKEDVFSSRERSRAESNPWSLDMNSRWKLYRTWIKEYIQHQQTQHNILKNELERQIKKLNEIKDLQTSFILSQVRVVGMTTTGAARLNSVIRSIRPPIVMVEEAAEVFEAHIVASLTKDCEHLILIGDHQQLRPNPTVYELCQEYHLDVSLFERLIRTGLDHTRLHTQHRMLPAISRLIVPHIYKDLLDHPSVRDYPMIRGVESNVFFINHCHQESCSQVGRSRYNDHESEFLVELCRYLLKQKYEPEQITILTTYSGQLFELRKKMPVLEFEGVRATTVDNYQGEENDIILLSLVRSNVEGSIGFLGVDNRVCVALSRARHALYCVGNISQLATQSTLWKNIAAYLVQEKMIDLGLPLKIEFEDSPYKMVCI